MNYEKVFITMHMIVKVYHKNAPYAINNLATHCSYRAKRNGQPHITTAHLISHPVMLFSTRGIRDQAA